MSIENKIIDYTDGTKAYKAYMAWDGAVKGKRPGVLVAHTWAGRSAFECGKADTLAKAGYVGLAIDMYGDGKQGTSVEENVTLMTPLMEDRAELQQRVNLGLTTLKSLVEVDESQTAAIGFCFGGLVVLDLARSGADTKGVASFHGLFNPADNIAETKIKAKVLCMHGFDDPMVPHESIIALGKELTEAGADWQIHAYGNTVHAFTNPEANDTKMGTVYNSLAHDRSRQSLLNFLGELF